MDNFEGVVEFVHCFGLGQLVVLHEVSPVLGMMALKNN